MPAEKLAQMFHETYAPAPESEPPTPTPATPKPDHEKRIANMSQEALRQYAKQPPEKQAQYREGFGHGGDDAGLKAALDKASAKLPPEPEPKKDEAQETIHRLMNAPDVHKQLEKESDAALHEAAK